MSLNHLDYTIVFIYIVLTLVIGLSLKKQAGKSLDNYFLGGRSLPWWLAGTSMVATTFAADTPLAVTELVAQGGISSNWLWWNMLAGGMFTTFFFSKFWRRSRVMTDLEIIDKRYDGRSATFLRAFRSVYLGLFINTLIIAWVNLALMTLLQVFFPEVKDYLIWCVAVAMILVVVYSSVSGLLGIVYTDLFQFIVALGGCIVLAFFVLFSDSIGGVDGLKAKLPESTLSFFPSFNSNVDGAFSLGVGSFLTFALVQWWAAWYPGAEPGGGGYIAQRILSTKDERHATAATLFFQVMHYCIRPWPWIIVALAALVLYPDLAPHEKRLGFVMAMRDFLPSGFKGLLLVAFFSAYMSTVSTQLNWGCSYFINDLYKCYINPNLKEKNLVRVSRFVTVVLMFLSLWATTLITSISQVWSFIIECGAGLGFVLILRWYWWRINAWSEIVGSITPFFVYGFTQFVLAKSDKSWSEPIFVNPKSFLLTVFVTIVATIIVTFLTKPVSKNRLKSFVSRIRPLGFWKPVTGENYLKELIPLSISWVSAIVFSYSLLFLMGNLIFKNWVEACICAFAILISFLIFLYSLRISSSKVSTFSKRNFSKTRKKSHGLGCH